MKFSKVTLSGKRATAAAFLILLLSATSAAHSQTFTVLHTFTGGGDGASPYDSLAIDRNGNLYGAATFGGNPACNGGGDLQGCGVIFKMSRRGSAWEFLPLRQFTGSAHGDGSSPVATPTIAADGTLYGTTDSGGMGNCNGALAAGCGTVYRLQPPLTVCSAILCPWGENVLYRFSGGADGGTPDGRVVFDSAGRLDGTALFGGASNQGVVFQLTHAQSGWTQSVLHAFSGGTDGSLPYAGPTLDAGGNIYGTTLYGGGSSCQGYGCGTVYHLVSSGSGWTENTLYSFEDNLDGESPVAGLVLDPAGNLYGASIGGGYNAIFEMTPSNGGWSFNNLYNMEGGGRLLLHGTLARDAQANLYGTTFEGGQGCVYGCGTVFKLSPAEGGWSLTVLYQFTGGSDGSAPYGGVVLDSAGNLYGATTQGGDHGKGPCLRSRLNGREKL